MSGSRMVKNGLDARKKANALRKQKVNASRNRGIPSNALTGTANGGNRGFSNLPHHNIQIHEVFFATSGSYVPGDYKIILKVLPFKWLQSSPYAPLLDIYEKMRVNSYTISVYLPTMSPVAKASTASWLARDSTVITGIAGYTQVLEQPGHQRGLGHRVHTYSWKPVEPDDYDYRECASSYDTFDWGTLLYTCIGAVAEFPEHPNPIIEYRATYSFANLRAPTQLRAGLALGPKREPDCHADRCDSIEVVEVASPEISPAIIEIARMLARGQTTEKER